MATPGHPFDTKDRDQFRSEQRRLLRHLDPWIIRTAMAGVRDLAVPRHEDREVLEEAIRAGADVLASNLHSEISSLADRHRAHALQSLCNETPSKSFHHTADPLKAWRKSVAEMPAGLPEELPDEVVGQLQALAVLLRWADLIADDDYEDPRFAESGATTLTW